MEWTIEKCLMVFAIGASAGAGICVIRWFYIVISGIKSSVNI